MIGALITLIVIAMVIGVLYFSGYISFGKLEKGDFCVPDEFKDNATNYVIDDESKCVVSNCASGFTLSGGVCVAVEDAITAGDACIPTTYVEGGLTYQQIKNSDETFTCKPTACSTLYTYDSATNNCTQTVVNAGDACIPDPYVTYGNSYTYGADATTCELAGCSDSYDPIDGKCMQMCGTDGSTNGVDTAPDNSKFYKTPGNDDSEANCTAYCDSGYTGETTSAGTLECTNTSPYTPRRSRYNMRYNSKKLEGVRL